VESEDVALNSLMASHPLSAVLAALQLLNSFLLLLGSRHGIESAQNALALHAARDFGRVRLLET
jgi:hypothetical protein